MCAYKRGWVKEERSPRCGPRTVPPPRGCEETPAGTVARRWTVCCSRPAVRRSRTRPVAPRRGRFVGSGKSAGPARRSQPGGTWRERGGMGRQDRRSPREKGHARANEESKPTFALPLAMSCRDTTVRPDSGGWSPGWIPQHPSAVVIPAVHGVFWGTGKNLAMGKNLLSASATAPSLWLTQTS